MVVIYAISCILSEIDEFRHSILVGSLPDLTNHPSSIQLFFIQVEDLHSKQTPCTFLSQHSHLRSINPRTLCSCERVEF